MANEVLEMHNMHQNVDGREELERSPPNNNGKMLLSAVLIQSHKSSGFTDTKSGNTSPTTTTSETFHQ